MSFFDSLFGITKKKDCPHIKFGRFSDNYKAPEKYKAWDKAEDDFRSDKYFDAIEGLLYYLKNENDDNIAYEREGDSIKFHFYQGSKKIEGYTNDDKFYAEAKIVKSDELNIGLMRSMLEKNFNLQYSKYFVNKSGELVISMTSYLSDCSPFHLYYGLKELAINADREDDLLLDEFKMLEPVNIDHLVGLTDTEKDIKFRFIQEQIKQVLETIDNSKLNYNELPISSSYLLLSTVYKLDYLIRPEGFVMKILDKSHFWYYAQNGYSVNKKNYKIRKELEKLIDREQKEVYEELYNVISTFSVSNPISHAQLVEFIDGELGNFDWYYDNKHMSFAQAITDFIVGFNLFNNTLPQVDREMFHFYYRVTNQKIFQELGFDDDFVEDGVPNERIIKAAMDDVIERNQKIYPNLKPAYNILSFKDIASFSKSLLLMIRTFDVYKPKI